MTAPNPMPELQVADVLIYYDRFSVVDWFIALRTWCWSASHIEVYAGANMSFASRNGIGVNRYLFRRKGLSHILRPLTAYNSSAAMSFFYNARGTKYGWLDLLQFFSIRLKTKGLICSQFADLLLRAGGVIAFSRNYNAGAISPRDFLISPTFQEIWSAK